MSSNKDDSNPSPPKAFILQLPSWPKIDVWVAWKVLKLKHYDTKSNYCTLSIKDLSFRDGMDDKPISEVVSLCGIIRQTLHSIHKSDNSVKGWHSTIGIAGSSPLLLLESIIKIDPKTNEAGYRWEHKYPWTPSDLDVFITRGQGDSYRLVTRRFQENLGFAASRAGLRLTGCKTRRARYARWNEIVWITDFFFENINTKISLIDATGSDEHMDSVVRSFDIDICKVIYNPCTGLLHVKASTLQDVFNGRTDVELEPIDTYTTGPTTYEAHKISSTLMRMVKYQHRDYRVGSFRLEFNEQDMEDPETHLEVEARRQRDTFYGRNLQDMELENIED